HTPQLGVERPEDIGAAARELVEAESELIIVNGGDGTVQAVLTALFDADPETLPLLAVLPSGTTTRGAADVDAMMHPVPALQRLLQATDEGRLGGAAVRRPVMRAEI